MPKRDYSNIKLITKDYPELIEISEGFFQREWSIIFKDPILEDANLIQKSTLLSYEGFQVDLKKISHTSIIACVTTNLSDTDYLFFTTSNLFAEIDYLLSEIDSIQGKARQDWFPWLSTRSDQVFNLSRWIIRKIEVGLRNTGNEGLSFFGIDQVNKLLEESAKATSIQPGGAITKQQGNQGGSVSFEVSGFFIVLILEEYPPSLATNF
ncbi:MAG: hypothetical protein WA902_14845 [Thermosynechococcaceae cyanobacterium]